MEEPEARQLSNDWSHLHDESWHHEAPWTADNERLARVAMRRHVQALLPEGGEVATVLKRPEDPPVIAAISGHTLFLARLVSLDLDKPAVVGVEQVNVDRARCDLSVEASFEEGFGTFWRRATWTLRRHGEEVVKFTTSAHNEEDFGQGEEALAGAIAARLDWAIPGRFKEAGPLRAA